MQNPFLTSKKPPKVSHKLLLCYLYVCYWGLNLGPIFVMGVFKIGSHELFPWAGFEL
jgi:hypothetical protein